MPTMPGTFSVPARQPRSCPPPSTIRAGGSGSPKACARHTRAPTPLGPWNLWAETLNMSMPMAAASSAMCPAACTASVWKSAPASWARRAASSKGCTVPTSLFTAMRLNAHTSGPMAASMSSTRTTPFSVGASNVTVRPSSSSSLSVWSTAGCSICDDTMRVRPCARPHAAPVRSAWLSASLPPEVNTTSPGLHPRHTATSSRASSIAYRAARPAACCAPGLPHMSRR